MKRTRRTDLIAIAILCLVIAASCTDPSALGARPYVAWGWGDAELALFLFGAFGFSLIMVWITAGSMRTTKHVELVEQSKQLSTQLQATRVEQVVSEYGLTPAAAQRIVDAEAMTGKTIDLSQYRQYAEQVVSE